MISPEGASPAPPARERAGRLSRVSLRSALRRSQDALFSRTDWVGGLLVAAIGLLLWPDLGFQTPLYEVGEIAPRTVRASADFTYEDAAATRERRREAVELVPDVYDFDAQAREQARGRIARAFAFGRAAIASGAHEESDFAATVSRLLDAAVTTPQLDLLTASGFADEVRQNLADSVASVLARDIIEGKGALAALGRPIRRRDLSTGASVALRDYSNVLSLEEARSAVELQILALSELASGPRRTLAELAAALVRPTLERNAVETTRLRSEAQQAVDPVVIQVRRGRTVVRAGDEVTGLARRQLEEMRSPESGRSGWAGLGALLFAFVVVALLRVLLRPARSAERWVGRAFAMGGAVIALHLALTRILGFVSRGAAAQLVSEPFSDPSVYLWVIPFASAALLMVILENEESAVVTQALFAAALSMMTGNPILGLFALLGGLGAIFIYRRSGPGASWIRVGALFGLMGAGLVIAIELVGRDYGGFPRLLLEAASAFTGGLLVAPFVILLLPLFENLFERTSEMRLMELARRDNPLLRQLALKAPGTYQHSVTVGLLSESAADAIGANSSFCSTAALYHDIGKLNRARYFVENAGGATPHDALSPEKSAEIIRKHVTEGIEAAERLNLPKDVVDVIPQHHGTRIIRVFWEKAKQRAAATGEMPDEALFRYPGPRPQTREAAIIMAADSIEAAARSLKDPTRESFERVIDRIMDSIVGDDQFGECDLTLSDLERIRGAFLSTLLAIHHERLPYPGFDFGRRRHG